MHVCAVLSELIFGFRRNGFFGKVTLFVYRIPTGEFISFAGGSFRRGLNLFFFTRGAAVERFGGRRSYTRCAFVI